MKIFARSTPSKFTDITKVGVAEHPGSGKCDPKAALESINARTIGIDPRDHKAYVHGYNDIYKWSKM